ncbi:hybrid sensor histidine kinase/response regulator transcription factor [Pseudochryseolinea flava]|uniref:histidine kinase n=1 Tax=Pseudochryseolinea flava TaxID=2059302 RepID=A0A364XZU0_9BACT|nr:two-component regulator propeller domain-containing protein [Pseudochryseolinea flava]RAW00052.1 hybrid sensor histidine kinase/response regulator [Pseudochryseolinea flava]
MRLKSLFLFLCISVAVAIHAQPLQYKFVRLTASNGLSNNQVTCFLKDSRGFIWIGTSAGLNRFDGYTFKTFRNDTRDSSSITSSFISSLMEDPDGRIWISSVYNSAQSNVYDPATEKFTTTTTEILESYGMPGGVVRNIVKDSKDDFWFLHERGLFHYSKTRKKAIAVNYIGRDSTAFSRNGISDLNEDINGDFWAIQRNGVLLKFSGKNYKVIYRNNHFRNLNLDVENTYHVLPDNDGDVWIYPSTASQGVYYLNVASNVIRPINERSPNVQLSSNIVRGMVQDNAGKMWVGTDHGGVNIIDKKNWTIKVIRNNPEDLQSISQNSLTALYKDRSGVIWLATFKQGACYYHEDIIRFPLYRHDSFSSRSLPFDDINRFAEDDKGNIWIGSNGGGLIYFDRANQTFTSYRHDPKNPHSLSSDVVVSLHIDRDKRVWVGTYFGGLNLFDGKGFKHFRHNPNDARSLADDNVWEIYEDRQDNLWIGTIYAGLELMDRKAGTFTHFRGGDINSVHTNYISELVEDSAGNLWVGTGWGIDLLRKGSSSFEHIVNLNNSPDHLSSNSILCIFEDSRGLIWIGTQEGLNLYNPTTKKFSAFRDDNGLPHNTVFTIVEDDAGSLWMSTPNGISNVKVRLEGETVSCSFHNYDEADGLQGKHFNENARLKTSKGELIFAGAYGFNIFKAENIQTNMRKPEIILTDLQVFNKSVGIGENANGHVILDKSITTTDHITLKYNENVFSIEFAALNYFHPEKSEYRYTLEGFSKTWVTTDGNSRRVTYTNLDPGDYVFHVQGSNNDGLWNEKGVELKITILPPFWKTRIAIALYMLFIIGALFITRRLIQQRERMKFAIEQERQEAQRMHELDMMKIKFFTNVSHEFRTPLTLILTPVEKLLKTATDESYTQFQMIHRNARRLLNLVNQLLDFRKLEVQEVRLSPSEGDIIRFIQETVYSFSDLSEKKDIRLEFSSTTTSFETLFDADKLEKILFNLLSNAFKFTPEHGAVSVAVSVLGRNAGQWLEIKVRDTGIGIPPDKLDKVFERFFQSDLPRTMVNQGSGIGLAITKEFVRIHGGTINVESEVGKGTIFTVSIPVADVVHQEKKPVEEVVPIQEISSKEAFSVGDAKGTADNKLPVLLLVEDNEDFRFYLKDNLKDQYNIVEARNGKEGWQRVVGDLPDLVVSDVMMPLMNGIELSKKIKNDPRVSHIPVILLTARTAEEQKLEGFQSGADDYMTKPFNFEILQSRIKNLIHQRELFHKHFRKQFEVKASDVNITSLDEKLIQNAIKSVEQHVSDPDFSVEDLSRELGMSRVHLYKKLLALTGKSPLEFIRVIRLQQAAQLLEKSQLTVSEIAYKVGFNNPKYFTKYFKEEYSMLPSAYAAEKRNKGQGRS